MVKDRLRGFDTKHSRVWTLLLLRALSKAGVTPCNNRAFHRALYFGNTLARVYEFDSPAELVMRHPRGPFYPKAQTDLDWLCLVSFASIQDVSYELVAGSATRRATYEITSNGYQFANKCIRDIKWASDSSMFLDDLAVAFSEVVINGKVDLENYDPTYQKATSEKNPVIYFGTSDENKSYRASEEIVEMIPFGLRPIPQTTLKLYIDYLEHLAA